LTLTSPRRDLTLTVSPCLIPSLSASRGEISAVSSPRMSFNPRQRPVWVRLWLKGDEQYKLTSWRFTDEQEEEETVKDRGNFIPKHEYPALKGKAVGLLVGNPLQALNAQDGGGGPPDALVFSTDGGCYRWVYVPVKQNPAINNLDVRVGERGDEKKVFSSLDMANAETVKQWDAHGTYLLVELEVNDNLGAPKCEDNQGFVATKMRQLDGTKEFPLKVEEAPRSPRLTRSFGSKRRPRTSSAAESPVEFSI